MNEHIDKYRKKYNQMLTVVVSWGDNIEVIFIMDYFNLHLYFPYILLNVYIEHILFFIRIKQILFCKRVIRKKETIECLEK